MHIKVDICVRFTQRATVASVRGMNTFSNEQTQLAPAPPPAASSFSAMLEAMTGSALDVLADFDREAALNAGIDPTRVAAWGALHEIYFGAGMTRHNQLIAADKARAGRFSLDQLAMLERRLKVVSSKSMREKLRITLLDAASRTRSTYRALAEMAKKLIPATAPAPKKGVSFSTTRRGLRTMAVTADERDIADLEFALSQGLDTAQAASPQLLRKFLQLIRGESAGVARAVPRPQLLIPLPQYVEIVEGRGDEVVLGLTDGTTMTGAQYLNQFVATGDNHLEAAVFHPTHGAVNLYRDSRLANAKQRDLARAAMPVCTGPNCRRGADQCEIHHITAWKNGGETNLANLAPLCRYHNRVNDDDAHRARRGRIEMHGGTPTWISPFGRMMPPEADNPHRRFGAMPSLFGHR